MEKKTRNRETNLTHALRGGRVHFSKSKGRLVQAFLFRSLFVCLGGRNFQQVPDAEVGCRCLPRYLILDVHKVLGRVSTRRRNAQRQVAFFQVHQVVLHLADWRSRSQCRHWTSEGKINTLRTIRKRNWQNKRFCGYKKCVGRWKMTLRCALQMRSTFGTDILMQETGSF